MIRSRRLALRLDACLHPVAVFKKALRMRTSIRAATELLSRRFGEELEIEVAETFYRVTARCRVVGPPSASVPSSVILKRSKAKRAGQTFDPDDSDPQGIACRLFNDWSGMEFLTAIASAGEGFAPICWGGDRELGFLLEEDCGERSLDELLMSGSAGEAEAALVETCRKLGRMHAGSHGREDEYTACRRRLGPVGEGAVGTEDRFRRQLAAARENLAARGFELEPECLRSLAGVAERIAAPGPLNVYTHGDLCPDNVRLAAGRPFLIDFEYGSFRHALTDAVFGRMMFPTCWKVRRLPSTVIDRMEDAYRSELVAVVPEIAEGGLFHRAVLDACAYWLIAKLAVALRTPQGRKDRLSAVDRDKDWGLSSLRQIVLARLQAFVATAERFGLDPAARVTFARVRDELERSWGYPARLPLFPAFDA